MNLRKSAFILIGSIFVMTAVSAFGQGSAFSDPNVDYTFDLPDAKWKMTAKPSATNPNVEYVYGDRLDGHLSIRKQTVAKDATMSDAVGADEPKRQFLPGYVAGKQETFAGKLKGVIFNFEYVNGGRAMGARYYYLRANDTTVYILRFSGQKDPLRSIRNQTDSIARTFAVK